MAVILITGVPGSGKSLYALKLVQEMAKKGLEKNQEPRPVTFYNYDGIDQDKFTLKTGIPCYIGNIELLRNDRAVEEFTNPHDIIVIDECQKFWRQRQAGTFVPKFVQSLEEHRHHGVDIFFITQDPMLIDVNIRRMAERFIAINRPFGFNYCRIFEYASYQRDPFNSFIAKGANSTTNWKYDKSLYELYKSAQVHTVKSRIPKNLIYLGLGIAFVAYMAWNGLKSLGSIGSGAQASIAKTVVPAAQAAPMPVNYAPPPQAGALPNFGASVKPPEPPKEEKKEPKPFPEEIDYRKLKLVGLMLLGSSKNAFFLYDGVRYDSDYLVSYGHEIEYLNGRTIKLNGRTLGFVSPLDPAIARNSIDYDKPNPLSSLPTAPSVPSFAQMTAGEEAAKKIAANASPTTR